VDIVTHGLASLAVARGVFPRAGKAAMAAALVAGTIADVDFVSYYLGPSAFLAWHGTYTHSMLAALVFSAILIVIPMTAVFSSSLGMHLAGMEGTSVPNDRGSLQRLIPRKLLLAPFLLLLCAALLHIAMDACQSDGVMLFWPFSPRRFAMDWLPGIDPWILTILIIAIGLPELLRLVGSEIGAKTKRPRGQTGALIGLALIFLYVGARATLHSNVLALLGSRTFHGELVRRKWAFPEPLSLLTWHGVVETETALDSIDINPAAARDFDPDLSLRMFKPEPSPALAAARATAVAKQFLATAQIPKASVEKIETGYAVTLRDLRYPASGQTRHEVAAYIEVDRKNQVTDQELVWARDLRQ
jgi:membrane-bound metal-dependent hydrolase YbcI (DUF457 family)